MEFFHCFLKLKTSTAHIRENMSAYLNIYLLRKCCSGLVFSLTFYEYISRHNNCFCFFSGIRQISLYEQYIQTFFHVSIRSCYQSLYFIILFLQEKVLSVCWIRCGRNFSFGLLRSLLNLRCYHRTG